MKKTSHPGNASLGPDHEAAFLSAETPPLSAAAMAHRIEELQARQAELERQNEELRRASSLVQSNLEAVLDSAPIPIVTVEVRPDGQRLLAYQNPAAARLFGAEAVGRTCKPTLCNKEVCPVLASETGVVRDRECAVKTKSGKRIMYKTARKMPDAPYIIEAMVDVTELMRARKRLTRAVEAAEAANRAKSEFLATMSHEIRTPLNGILGMIELALHTEMTPQQREYLELGRQSASSLLGIVNDILDFSHIQAGRLELARVSFDPRERLESCLGLFADLAARQGDRLELTVSPDVPEFLVGDPARLGQILANLVSNGLKFTRNGSVRVNVQTCPAQMCPLDGQYAEGAVSLLFSVADTGIGIPKHKHNAVFDAFSQGDGTLTRRFGGTGLGLSIARHLTEMMHGRLWLESEPGQGSTFFFTAVFDRSEPAGVLRPWTPTPTDRPAIPTSLRILLVEENAIRQLATKRMLERHGHSVTIVDSGQAALELLLAEPFHCLLLDADMAERDGGETLRRLRHARALGGAAAPPVVALTAQAVTEYRERILALGFDGTVSSPLDMRELDAVLEQAAIRNNRAAADGRERAFKG